MHVALIALAAYLAVVIILISVLKRGVSESMVISFFILCLFAGTAAPAVMWNSFIDAALNPIVFSVIVFVFLGTLFDRTGIINRQIDVLNSVLGRVPGGAGYVSTVSSALFGAVSHGGSANAAAVGSVTVPWMKKSGWPSHVAATLVAGNSGIGHVIPPSPSMLLLLGMGAVAPFATISSMFLPLILAACWLLLYRLAVTFFFVRRYKVEAVDRSELMSFMTAFRRGYLTFLVFLGILIPLMITLGPVGAHISDSIGAVALKLVNIIVWIPVLMLVLTVLLGLKSLPRKPKEVVRLFSSTAPAFVAVGATVLFAFAASEALTALGLGDAMEMLLDKLDAPPIVLLIIVGIVLVLVAGPLPAAATTATLGSVAFTTLTDAGIGVAAAIAAILIFVSTEGASPPAGAPIYIASGQAKSNPVKTFVPLVTLYVVPFIVLGVLIGGGILPIG
ncbi:TRAP transporter large permease subunit (plasmid) [Rhodococcoides fascians]|uniref:TRAP transporter large permease subunit n=1 Tax=Rhodococcoides fascians TaxID=1828 RepID=UPI00389A6416